MGDLRFSEQCCGGFRSVIVSLCVCVVPDVWKDCGTFRLLGRTCCQTKQHHVPKYGEPLPARTQGTACCQTTQHHIPKHREPLTARQNSITSQNTGNNLLPNNTAIHYKMLGITCCQTTHHFPKHNNTAVHLKDLNPNLTFWFNHAQLYVCLNCYP